MLRMLAMVGDAEASAHLRSSLGGVAQLQFVRDVHDLVQQAKRSWPDVIVVGIGEAARPVVRVTVRQILERSPASRVLLICRLDPTDMRVLGQARYLDASDIIFVRIETTGVTRDRLLKLDHRRTADTIVRRVVCPLAPTWLQPYLDSCATDAALMDVQSLARIGRVRRETLARQFKSRGLCSPNALLAWMVLLRATARLAVPGTTLASVARDLGLASGASLANLFRRWAGRTPTQVRAEGFDRFAERAVRTIFGSRRERTPRPKSARSSTHRAVHAPR